MADAAFQVPEFNPSDDVGFVRVDQIEMGDRLRPVDEVYAAGLGQVMQRDGQRTPIEVCLHPFAPHYTLVTGAHRLRAAQLIGLEHIKATVISAGEMELKLAEVSENLFRRDLSPYDRATFVAELVALRKIKAGIDPAKDGRTVSATARWQKSLKIEADDTTAKIAVAYGFSEDVAAAVGLSVRTVRDDVLLYRRLTPITIDALRSVNHPLLGNASQLRALAKLEPAQQADVVGALLGRGKFDGKPAKTIAEAQARMANRKAAAAEDKRLSAFIGTFNRMSIAEKRGALAVLADMLPAGWTLTGPKGGEA